MNTHTLTKRKPCSILKLFLSFSDFDPKYAYTHFSSVHHFEKIRVNKDSSIGRASCAPMSITIHYQNSKEDSPCIITAMQRRLAQLM